VCRSRTARRSYEQRSSCNARDDRSIQEDEWGGFERNPRKIPNERASQASAREYPLPIDPRIVRCVDRPVQRLDLRFDLEDPDHRDYPVVTILVDGKDVLANARGTGFIGFDPAAILGADSPLLPSDSPRRVAVYRCSCGEPGCGVVAPIISEADGRIGWSDFRDYTGVFVEPEVDAWTTEEILANGDRLGLPEIYFDSEQYRAEVARASADESWETKRRRTARLLQEYLESEAAILEEKGYQLTWAALEADDPAAYHVSLWKEDAQIVVEIRADEGSPEERAATMAERLLRSSPDEWRVVFRGGAGSDG
jgi:hypothetical protein